MLNAKYVAKVLMRPGSVVVMPTDTIYGLVARALDPVAVSRLYALKDRHSKPGTMLGLDIEQLSSLGIARRYLKAVEQFWPGAVSVVIPIDNHPTFSYLSQGRADLAVRIPDNSFVASVLALSGPLMTTSVNPPSLAPAENIVRAKEYFGGRVDAYFDGGDLAGRQPSTIIRVIDDSVELIRRGSVELPGV